MSTRVTPDPDELLRLCVFSVGAELFAIDIMRIREIVRPSEVTPVPKSPFGMVGVIDLRGSVLPLFDLRLRFEVAQHDDDERDRTRYLIVSLDNRQLGLVVDRVHDVIDIARRDLRVGPGVLAGDAARYFVGLCPVRNRLALLLNLRRLLSEEDKVAIDRVARTTSPRTVSTSNAASGTASSSNAALSAGSKP